MPRAPTVHRWQHAAKRQALGNRNVLPSVPLDIDRIFKSKIGNRKSTIPPLHYPLHARGAKSDLPSYRNSAQFTLARGVYFNSRYGNANYLSAVHKHPGEPEA